MPAHQSHAVFGSHRRTRRFAASLVALIGMVTLASALSPPLGARVRTLEEILPLVVPETAAALSAVAGLGLLVVARGVRRGQRRAWATCMVLLTSSVVLHLLKGLDIGEATVSAAVAGYLWLRRDRFPAASDTPSLRRGIPALAAAVAAALAGGTVGIETSTWLAALHGHGAGRMPLGRAFAASAGRLVGIDLVALPHRFAAFFDPAMSTAAAGIALGALVLVFRPAVAHWHGRDETLRRLARARAIVGRHGGGTLDYFALREDKRFFFAGDSVVAYAVYGTFCLVSPDPIGPAHERAEVWRAFRAFVDAQGWALGVLAAGAPWRELYRAGGMRELYIGDEAVVALQEFSLQGGTAKGLRQAAGRVARHGYTVSFHDPAQIEPALRAQLRAISSDSRRGEAERGFSMTLGRLFDPEDKGLLLAVVHAPAADGQPHGTAGRPVAFCHYVPAPDISGYSLDVMRRERGTHPNGLIDFALVETIRHLAAQGHGGLGLNFAVMRAVFAGETGGGAVQRAQAWATRSLAGASQAESLWRFNAKYHPRWVSRYAYCDAPEHVISAALAIARAESLWELPLVGRFLSSAARAAARAA